MNRKLNILYVVNRIRQTSSPLHEHVVPMSRSHNVSVCSYYSVEAAMPSVVDYVSGEGKVVGFLSALRKIYKTRRYDVVHFHAPHSCFISLLYLIWFRMLNRDVFFYTVHNSYSRYNLVHRALIFFIFLSVDKIVHCSHSSDDSFTSSVWSLFRKKRVVIQNGVNLDFVDSVLSKLENNCRSSDEQLFSIVNIGRLVDVKNHAFLLRSLAKLRNERIKLTIIGTGPLLEQLEKLVQALDFEEQVKFEGAVNREDVYRILAASDLFVSTSTLEGFPLAVLESLACGCPVVLSDIPPHREVGVREGCIKLIESDDSSALIEAVDEYLSLTIDQRKEIDKGCREHVNENHSMNNMNYKYTSMYNDMLEMGKLSL